MPWISLGNRNMEPQIQFLTVNERLIRFRTVSGADTFAHGVFGQVLRLPRPPATVQTNLLPGVFIAATDLEPRCLLLESVPSVNSPFAVWFQRTIPRVSTPWTVTIEEFRAEEIGVEVTVNVSDVFNLVVPSSSTRTDMIISYICDGGVDLRFDNTGRLPVTIPLFADSGSLTVPPTLATCQVSARRRVAIATGTLTVVFTR